MIRAVIIALVVACATPPKTEASMREWRLAHDRDDARSGKGCRRTCPVGRYIAPVEPQAEHVEEDCCYDIDGLAWSACAWNGDGRFMTPEQLLASERLGGNCGTDGFPDCPPTRSP